MFSVASFLVWLPHERITSETTSKPNIQFSIKLNGVKKERHDYEERERKKKKRQKEFNLMNSRLHQCVTFGQTIEKQFSTHASNRKWRILFYLLPSPFARSPCVVVVVVFSLVKWHAYADISAQLGTDLDIIHLYGVVLFYTNGLGPCIKSIYPKYL